MVLMASNAFRLGDVSIVPEGKNMNVRLWGARNVSVSIKDVACVQHGTTFDCCKLALSEGTLECATNHRAPYRHSQWHQHESTRLGAPTFGRDVDLTRWKFNSSENDSLFIRVQEQYLSEKSLFVPCFNQRCPILWHLNTLQNMAALATILSCHIDKAFANLLIPYNIRRRKGLMTQQRWKSSDEYTTLSNCYRRARTRFSR